MRTKKKRNMSLTMILPRNRAPATMMKIQKVMITTKFLLSYKMMYYVLFKTN